jgi:integrase
MTLLLTMQRRQELALATKKEFDLENRTWSRVIESSSPI